MTSAALILRKEKHTGLFVALSIPTVYDESSIYEKKGENKSKEIIEILRCSKKIKIVHLTRCNVKTIPLDSLRIPSFPHITLASSSGVLFTTSSAPNPSTRRLAFSSILLSPVHPETFGASKIASIIQQNETLSKYSPIMRCVAFAF